MYVNVAFDKDFNSVGLSLQTCFSTSQFARLKNAQITTAICCILPALITPVISFSRSTQFRLTIMKFVFWLSCGSCVVSNRF